MNNILCEGSPEAVGMDSARLKRLKKAAAGWVTDGDPTSLVLLAARRGTIVLQEAFGVRHPDDTTPTLKPDAIFPVMSCAKPITAALVMCLVEDGLIGLNRPFIEYVPELDVPNVQWLEEARVADLLCHTSGIDDLVVMAHIKEAAERSPGLPPSGAGQHAAVSRRIRLAAGAPLAHRPGSVMLYSNFGFNLLGDIVRRVSGQSLEQFAQARLFGPLAMSDTHYKLPAELRNRRVFRAPGMPGTQPFPGVHGGIDSLEFDAYDAGSNGLKSTSRDLAAFLQMLLGQGRYGEKRLLTRASVAAMTRPQVDEAIPWISASLSPTTGKRVEIEFKGGGYGYGLALFGPGDRYRANGSLASISAFGHVGYGSAFFWADPAQELVGVYLTVASRLIRDYPFLKSDLFQNAVYGAILD
jgi:CubicO group peptidase (beta-lactamase class C family)